MRYLINTILAEKFGQVLDENNYQAFKFEFNHLNGKTFMKIYKTEDQIYRIQNRDEDEVIIDENFEIIYPKEPWMHIDNLLSVTDFDIFYGIDDIAFATGSKGYWNILKKRGGVYPIIETFHTFDDSVNQNQYLNISEKFLPMNSTFGLNFAIEFEIKAENHANIHFCENDNCIELVIGGWMNTKSVIRAKSGENKNLVERFGKILDKNLYQSFKAVFNQRDGKTVMSIYRTKNPINQPRSGDGTITNENFEIIYEEEPWMLINDLLFIG